MTPSWHPSRRRGPRPETVIERWRRDGIDLHPGATPEQIATLHVSLPDDMRRYYSMANGIVDGEMAAFHANFWRIEKLLGGLFEISNVTLLRGDRNVALADVLIDSWFICFRAKAGKPLTVWAQGAGVRGMELPTLSDFFAAYLEDPRRLCL